MTALDRDRWPLDEALIAQRTKVFPGPHFVVGVLKAFQVTLVDDAEAADLLQGLKLGLTKSVDAITHLNHVSKVMVWEVAVDWD